MAYLSIHGSVQIRVNIGASVLLLQHDGREVRPVRVQREEEVEGGGCCPSLPLRCLSTRYLQILLFAAATTTQTQPGRPDYQCSPFICPVSLTNLAGWKYRQIIWDNLVSKQTKSYKILHLGKLFLNFLNRVQYYDPSRTLQFVTRSIDCDNFTV